jgi:outer membrane usher protein
MRRRRRSHGCRAVALAAARVATLLPLAGTAFAADCTSAGIALGTRSVMQLREAGQAQRLVMAFRDEGGAHWFLPLSGAAAGNAPGGREICTLDGAAYVKVAAKDPALTLDPETDIISFVDLKNATEAIDARRAPVKAATQPLNSVGLNYQFTASYAGNEARLSAYGDAYGWYKGWYASNTMGLSGGRLQRFDTFALHESLDTGTFLRVGDATTAPSPLGEALRFAGVAWGTDRGLQMGNYVPVLPDIRSGSLVAGPVEVFLNDTLRFQQNVQSGVYDVRNVPAQQGFNSYTVRTLDAQGNPVTVSRDIYLPAALLPPGISSWRVDAGMQRRDVFGENPRYSGGVLSGNYSRGITHDTTLGAYAIVNKDVSMVSADYDRRISDLWTGHLGAVLARSAGGTSGNAVRARLEGGGRHWRLFGEWLGAPQALPSLSPTRSALLNQRLIRAQWSGFSRATFSLTYAQSERVGEQSEEVLNLQAFMRPFDNGVVMVAGLFRSHGASGLRQSGANLSAIVPLDREKNVGQSVSGSYNAIGDTKIARVQYDRSNAGDGSPQSMSSLSVGANEDSRMGASADVFYMGNTDRTEIFASARAAKSQSDGQVTVRSGIVHTQGSTFFTRPVTGSFALVSTGQKDVTVFHENRPMGRTNGEGFALVTSLRPMEVNQMSVDPTEWPMNWNATVVNREVVPPRGGGVLVSFKVATDAWPADTMVSVPGPDGKPYPAGTVAYADVEGEERSTIINSEGQLWLGEFLPANRFTVRANGKRCDYRVPATGTDTTTTALLVSCTEGI